MTFQASDIGPKFDIGIATADGSNLTCVNDAGSQISLSSVAFVYSTEVEAQETTDLIRKEQLTRLSSANVIDREFQNWPQATQGNFSGGELQKVFVDPTSYYQGRGLIWPIGGAAIAAPVYATQAIAGTTTWPGVVAGGNYTGQGPGYAVAYTDGGGAKLRFQSNTTSVTSAALSGAVTNAIVLLGKIYFVAAGSTQLQTMSGAGPTIANFANPPVGAGGGLLAAGVVGTTVYIAVYVGTSTNTILVYDANNSATSSTVTMPAGTTLQAMAFLGSQLIFIVTDGYNNTLLSYDIPSAAYTTIAQLQGYSAISMAAVGGGAFLACTYTQAIDCYLLSGPSLQFIATVPALLTGTTSVAYVQQSTVSNVVGFGPYALFFTPSALYAYDVQRGAFFTVSDQWVATTIGNNSCAVTTGLTSAGPASVTAQWTVVGQATAGGGSVAQLFSFGVPLSGTLRIPSGRVTSSSIDFTSAAVKLFRQVVVQHGAIPAGGSQTVAVWLDQGPDNLAATPDFNQTNSTVGSTSTIVLINKLARKIVYLDDWSAGSAVHAPRPTSIIIQPATGWVDKLQLAISDSVRLNSQQANAFCFESQGVAGLDAQAAYNFIRQLWRTKGGRCTVTLQNSDSGTFVIESLTFRSKKPKPPQFVGDKRSRYETLCEVTLREDF
jgi:hypothetical protein